MGGSVVTVPHARLGGQVADITLKICLAESTSLDTSPGPANVPRLKVALLPDTSTQKGHLHLLISEGKRFASH